MALCMNKRVSVVPGSYTGRCGVGALLGLCCSGAGGHAGGSGPPIGNVLWTVVAEVGIVVAVDGEITGEVRVHVRTRCERAVGLVMLRYAAGWYW